MLGKSLIWVEIWPSAQPPLEKLNFGNTSQKKHDKVEITFLVHSSFTGFLYFVPNILSTIVGTKVLLKLTTLSFWTRFSHKRYFQSKTEQAVQELQTYTFCVVKDKGTVM